MRRVLRVLYISYPWLRYAIGLCLVFIPMFIILFLDDVNDIVIYISLMLLVVPFIAIFIERIWLFLRMIYNFVRMPLSLEEAKKMEFPSYSEYITSISSLIIIYPDKLSKWLRIIEFSYLCVCEFLDIFTSDEYSIYKVLNWEYYLNDNSIVLRNAVSYCNELYNTNITTDYVIRYIMSSINDINALSLRSYIIMHGIPMKSREALE